ncbi:hypothetical protein CBW16_06420 [Flavobacteriaceae bacterium JJC]|nr:hypothetical protein CBW16_06420 [Flavobacteriaceae bacterium JJC]
MNLSLRLLRKFSVLLPCLFFGFTFSQTLIHHTTNWFGPNANPVPDFTDATIPENTQLSIYGDYYYGYGDNTETVYIKAEIPLIPQKVSVKVWSPVAEHYEVTDEIKEKRMMLEGNSGFANGDVYIQTRISLAKELKYRPSVILNSTLKTASGSGFKNRRFFNTAGYYFDTEIGKSFRFSKIYFDEIRVVGNFGFYSWDVQTPNSNVQDDAPMYGLKLILKKNNFGWENTFSGYNGWINRDPDYGNRPSIFASKINYYNRKNTYFIQYQHGVNDFPYNQIRIGATLNFDSLTPNFF